MKFNQVIDVKPTRTEKEFLRLVLREVATTKGAPLDVAEKIEFGEVKHTIAYAYCADYHEDVEYSAIIGYETVIQKNGHSSKTGYIQWQEEPYYGKPSFDKMHISVLKNKDSGLYNWGNDSEWLQDYLKKSKSNDESDSSTEIINEEIEVPSELTFKPMEDVDSKFRGDGDGLSMHDVNEIFGYERIVGEMPGDEQTNVKIISHKTELIKEAVYKLHSYEVSYTYNGSTYFAKARATANSDKVLLASNWKYNSPQGSDVEDAVRSKERPFSILAHASWILTYASLALNMILSFLGKGAIWYLPFIMTAVSVVITVVCNAFIKKINYKMAPQYEVKGRTEMILASLRKAIAKLDLREIDILDEYRVKDAVKGDEFKFPAPNLIPMSTKIIIGIVGGVVVGVVGLSVSL